MIHTHPFATYKIGWSTSILTSPWLKLYGRRIRSHLFLVLQSQQYSEILPTSTRIDNNEYGASELIRQSSSSTHLMLASIYQHLIL